MDQQKEHMEQQEDCRVLKTFKHLSPVNLLSIELDDLPIFYCFAEKELVLQLVVPVVPQPEEQQRHIGAPNTNAPPNTSQISKQLEHINIQSHATLLSLPKELHLVMLSFLEENSIADVVCFCMANRYLWTLGLDYLSSYFRSPFGKLAGKKIVHAGAIYDWHFPALYDASRTKYSNGQASYYDLTGRGPPFELSWITLDGEHSELVYSSGPLFEGRRLEFLRECNLRGIDWDPAYPYIQSQLVALSQYESYFPEDTPWILRNLTTKQIVRAEAIALDPTDIRGPRIDVLGFGDIVMQQTTWQDWRSDDKSLWPTRPWAGHCFDIVTLERHNMETAGEEWCDVSEEVARDYADSYEKTKFFDGWLDVDPLGWRDLMRDWWSVGTSFPSYRPPAELGADLLL
ncbi:hypothetical protein F5Y16DRAFT_378517 [Xylariaceae sp. FL0255]|nr:hypothetical protein F5Y16DRAFT_378517 [Xylariaceae sp. FL0255]